MISQDKISARFNKLFEQLKSEGKIKSNKDLADKIGYSPQKLNEVLKGRTKFNLDFLKKFCTVYNVSLDFIALGIEKPDTPVLQNSHNLPGPKTGQSDIIASDIHFSPQGKLLKKINNNTELVPYYDIDFAAGNDIIMQDDASAHPAYYMDIPEFSGCTAFRAYSDSMEKLIMSGSILFGTKITTWMEHLEFGQIYSIICNDGRRYIKYIRKAEKDNQSFLLRSENKDYDDFHLPKSIIRSIWLIHGWLHKRT